MRLLSPQHAEALADALNWRENPFVQRDMRRDRHRKQPTKSFAWMSGMLLVIGGIALWLLHNHGLHGKGVPWWLGGELGTFLCILTVGIHILYITGASAKNATAMLTQEAYRNTLATLLMLPTPPFAMLVQACVYPWLAAMRVALVLLPVYVFCVGLNGISWLDLVMLYVVFALMSFAIPLWRRPALGDNLIAPTPTTQAATALAPNIQTAATNRAGAPGTATAKGNQSGNPALGILFGLFVPFFVISSMLGGMRGGWVGMHHAFNRYVPDSLLTLFPTFLFSWPLMFARALVTPFDWFGWPVIPLSFVLILFPLGRYLQLVRVSEWLSVGTFRDLATLPTYIPRRRWEFRLRVFQTLVIVGYLWKWSVADGHLGFAVTLPGPVAAPGLAGFAYLLLCLLLLITLIRGGIVGMWLRTVRRTSPLVTRQLHVRTLALYLVSPFALMFGFYLLCCLLARAFPFPPSVIAFGGPMLLLCLSGLIGALGTYRLLGASVILITTIAWGSLMTGAYTPPETKYLSVLTTMVGAIKIGHPNFFGLAGAITPPRSLSWWAWAVTAAIGGAASLLLAYLPALARSRSSVSPLREETVLRFDPTQVGEEVFSDPIVAQATSRAQSDTPLSTRVVALFQQVYDNAILTKELRARLRGKLDASSLPGFFGLMLALTIGGVFLPSIPEAFGSSMASILYHVPSGGLGTHATPDLANIAVCFYVVMLFIAFFSGFSTTVTFAQEREKSTLGFLLTTPMPSPAIVIGKAVGLLASSALVLVGLSFWTLALSLALLPSLGLMALVGWLEIVFTVLLLQVTVGMTGLALASLFPHRLPSSAQGFVGVGVWIFFQACIIVLPRLGAYLSNNGLDLSGYALYGAFVTFCLVVSSLAFVVAVWRVGKMRRGDMAFAASKREN